MGDQGSLQPASSSDKTFDGESLPLPAATVKLCDVCELSSDEGLLIECACCKTLRHPGCMTDIGDGFRRIWTCWERERGAIVTYESAATSSVADESNASVSSSKLSTSDTVDEEYQEALAQHNLNSSTEPSSLLQRVDIKLREALQGLGNAKVEHNRCNEQKVENATLKRSLTSTQNELEDTRKRAKRYQEKLEGENIKLEKSLTAASAVIAGLEEKQAEMEEKEKRRVAGLQAFKDLLGGF